MDDRLRIDVCAVRKLIADQMPEYAHLQVRPVRPGGWDNLTFRLGDRFLVRMPSAERYVAQVEKEWRWLQWLDDRLTFSVPRPVSLGRPGPDYPFPWAVLEWLDGTDAAGRDNSHDLALARELGASLSALRALPPVGPAAGAHSFHRGGDLTRYDCETREALSRLPTEFRPRARLLWERALASRWLNDPVWVHGDVTPGNILLRAGRFEGLLDFGLCCVGDPACDLVMAWTDFSDTARQAFRDVVGLDPECWQRAQGWALWKAAISLSHSDAGQAARARRTLAALCDEG